jgi:hypothetical protein
MRVHIDIRCMRGRVEFESAHGLEHVYDHLSLHIFVHLNDRCHQNFPIPLLRREKPSLEHCSLSLAE